MTDKGKNQLLLEHVKGMAGALLASWSMSCVSVVLRRPKNVCICAP